MIAVEAVVVGRSNRPRILATEVELCYRTCSFGNHSNPCPIAVNHRIDGCRAEIVGRKERQHFHKEKHWHQ